MLFVCIPSLPPEEAWLHNLSSDLARENAKVKREMRSWEIRTEGLEFKRWLSQLHKEVLFTDGTSKGNIGATGGVGYSSTQMERRNSIFLGGLEGKKII